jgi:hypothetical protein
MESGAQATGPSVRQFAKLEGVERGLQESSSIRNFEFEQTTSVLSMICGEWGIDFLLTKLSRPPCSTARTSVPLLQEHVPLSRSPQHRNADLESQHKSSCVRLHTHMHSLQV